MRSAVRFFIVPAIVGFVTGLCASRFRDSFWTVAAYAVFAALVSAFIPLIAEQGTLILASLAGGGRPALPYRRRKEQDTWHFCRNCSNWPTDQYEKMIKKPVDGEICNECESRFRNKECDRG